MKMMLVVDNQTFGTGTILDNGYLVLGQEQDSIGGGFATTQDFPGDYGYFAVYGRGLSDAEVEQNFNATKGSYGL